MKLIDCPIHDQSFPNALLTGQFHDSIIKNESLKLVLIVLPAEELLARLTIRLKEASIIDKNGLLLYDLEKVTYLNIL